MADRPLPAYDGDEPYVFVSFSHADERLVYPEIRWLQDHGVNVWYDEGISGGSRWRDSIATHLRGCHLLIFFVTPQSVASQVCREELEFALDEGRPILSVHLEPTELPDGVRMAIANRQALFHDDLDPDDYGRKLLSAVSTYLDRPAPGADGVGPRRRRQRRIPLKTAVPGALLVAVLAAGGTWLVGALTGMGGSTNESVRPGVVRFPVPVSADEVNLQDCYGLGWTKGVQPTLVLAFSSDGSMLVYAARDRSDDSQKLFLHRLDADRAVAIPETVGGYMPFFSPDDQWVYYFDGRQVRRVSVAGGAPEVIWDALPEARCLPGTISWLNDETLVLSGPNGGLQVLDATGGVPRALLEPDTEDGFGAYLGQHALPGRTHLLFHRFPDSLDPERAAVFVLDVATGEQQKLLDDAMHPQYLARSDHLLFLRRGTLMAVAFDPVELAIIGDPIIVQPGVRQAVGMPNNNIETGIGQFTVSASGHLAYLPGGLFPANIGSLVALGRDGVERPFEGPDDREFGNLRISPDGRYLAFSAFEGKRSSLHVYDILRGVTRTLKTGGFVNAWPVWSPDGEYIAFTSDREEGHWGIYRMRADGSGAPERLFASESEIATASWSATGDLAFLKDNDIWILTPDGEYRPLFNSPEWEFYAAFSPDGKWITYTAEGNVYARSYPGPGPAILVMNKGTSPIWSRDGRELFFLTRDDPYINLNVVRLQDGEFSVSEKLAPWTYSNFVPQAQFDSMPDGSILTVSREEVTEEQYRTEEIRVVLNVDRLIDRGVED